MKTVSERFPRRDAYDSTGRSAVSRTDHFVDGVCSLRKYQRSLAGVSLPAFIPKVAAGRGPFHAARVPTTSAWPFRGNFFLCCSIDKKIAVQYSFFALDSVTLFESYNRNSCLRSIGTLVWEIGTEVSISHKYVWRV